MSQTKPCSSRKLRASPPTFAAASMTRKSLTPSSFRRNAAPRPVGPAPRIRQRTFSGSRIAGAQCIQLRAAAKERAAESEQLADGAEARLDQPAADDAG